MEKSGADFFQGVAYLFSLYYLITGIWPLIDLSSLCMLQASRVMGG
jgi:hypothetical protein